LTSQFTSFKQHLSNFAQKHKKEITKDPLLRAHFQKMCTEIGVDPLASSKGFWAEMLGVGDFYYELAVQAVEVCMGMRAETGGLVDLEIVKAKISKMRSTKDKSVSITDDDVHRAIETLRPLSSGYQIITMGKRKMVQSVPREMSDDQSILINAASVTTADTHFLSFSGA
jgi:ESCRT-II complex subunit VPS22